MKNPPNKPEAVAAMRREKLQIFETFKMSCTNAVSARAARVSFSTIRRWQNRYTTHGLPGLVPGKSPGRRSQFSAVKLSAKAVHRLETCFAKGGSVRAGWVEFSKSPFCPVVVARYVKRTGHAPSKLAAIGRLTRVAYGQAWLSGDGRRIFLRLRNGEAFVGRLIRI